MPSYVQGKGWVARIRKGKTSVATRIFPTKREAIAWEVEKRKELSQPHTTGMAFVPTYEEYLDYAKVRFSHKTYVEKVYVGKRLIAFAGERLLPEITTKIIHDFLLNSAEKSTNNRSNRDRKNLLAFWAWCDRIHGIEGNPVARCQKLPHNRKAQFVPMESEIKQILMVCTRKERVFLNCYLQTAARRSSVFRWKWNEDIDFVLRQVRVGHSKNKDGSREYIWLPMTNELEEDLRWWRKNQVIRSEHVWVCEEGPYSGQPYTYRHKFLKGMCKRAGSPKMGFHALRRFAATRLAQSGIAMTTIQRILGHKALSTTERYLGRVNEDLRSAMELLGNLDTSQDTSFPARYLKISQKEVSGCNENL